MLDVPLVVRMFPPPFPPLKAPSSTPPSSRGLLACPQPQLLKTTRGNTQPLAYVLVDGMLWRIFPEDSKRAVRYSQHPVLRSGRHCRTHDQTFFFFVYALGTTLSVHPSSP